MSVIKINFIILLVLYSLVKAQTPYPEMDITRFGLNPTYGYIKSNDTVTLGMQKYLLLKFDEGYSGKDNFVIIDSIVSATIPQLCDSNAVSFIVNKCKDSAMLVVADFDLSTPSDTIAIYPIENLRSIRRYSQGQNRLYTLNRHLFYRPDSTLFWHVPYPGRSIMEIGRFLVDETYHSLRGFECEIPRMAGDFSMALYSRQISSEFLPYESARTQIIAYDFEKDTSIELRIVNGCCSSPHLRNKDDQLFCICIESINISNFCIVDDSIPRVLFSIEYPVSFSGFEIFQDSIVIKTENCCDKDYGLQYHVIQR